MSCIGFSREADRELHDMYSRKLLIPGWAGEVSDSEAPYIANELSKSQKLRMAWGVRHFFGKRWKHISHSMAKRLCVAWATNPTIGVKELSIASHEKDKKQTVPKSSGNGQQLLFPISLRGDMGKTKGGAA